MKQGARTALAGILCVAAFSRGGLAQAPPASILQIDVANNVLYDEDVSDVSKFATDPNAASDSHSRKNFNRVVGVADIVAVNGEPDPPVRPSPTPAISLLSLRSSRRRQGRSCRCLQEVLVR